MVRPRNGDAAAPDNRLSSSRAQRRIVKYGDLLNKVRVTKEFRSPLRVDEDGQEDVFPERRSGLESDPHENDEDDPSSLMKPRPTPMDTARDQIRLG